MTHHSHTTSLMCCLNAAGELGKKRRATKDCCSCDHPDMNGGKEMWQELPCDEVSEISSQAQAASNSSGRLSLDLSLTVAESSTSDTSTGDGAQAVAAREPARVFTCNYYQRKFFSSQALDGHQNAHRRVRTLRIDAATPYGHYADVASLPLYGLGLYPSGSQARPEQHGRHAPMPFFVGDEELSFGCWPGSFRAAAEPAGSAVVAVEEPDLTLRL
jgi:hypothetical protein